MTERLYGLDAELKAKQDAKFDPELEAQVVDWLVALTGEEKGPLTTAEYLNDGQVLCKAVNKILPGTIKRINTMKAPFKKMENITSFTDAARKLGVMESSMFATPDLYEEKNMGSVIACIFTFAGVVQTSVPEFQGPHLGVKINAVIKDEGRKKVAATQMGGLAGTLETEAGKVSARTGILNAGTAATTGAASGEVTQGLDADLKEKIAANYDPELDQTVCTWIEAVTREQRGEQTTAEWLKSGVILCKLANTIEPGACPNVSTSGTPFKQMENISLFLNYYRSLGMAESALFSTPDLFEEKNLPVVLQSLFYFGGVVQTKVPTFGGPHLGNQIHHEVADTNRGLGLVTDQNEAMQRHMEIDRPRDNQGIFR